MGDWRDVVGDDSTFTDRNPSKMPPPSERMAQWKPPSAAPAEPVRRTFGDRVRKLLFGR